MRVVLRIKEQLDPSWQKWFEGLEITHSRKPGKADGSLLSGELADQAALHGLVSKIFLLGLSLVSFESCENGN